MTTGEMIVRAFLIIGALGGVTTVIVVIRARRQLRREAAQPTAIPDHDHGSERMTGKPCLGHVYMQKDLTEALAKLFTAAQELPISSVVTDGRNLRVHVVVENPAEVQHWHLPMAIAFGNDRVQEYQRRGDGATVIVGMSGRRWDVCVSPRTTEK